MNEYAARQNIGHGQEFNGKGASLLPDKRMMCS